MDKVRENRLRRWAHRLDYVICRSRAKHLHSNDFGLYQVCNDRNEVVYGANYDLELDDVEAILADIETKMRKAEFERHSKSINDAMAHVRALGDAARRSGGRA